MQTKGSTQWYKLIAELIAHVTEEIVTNTVCATSTNSKGKHGNSCCISYLL